MCDAFNLISLAPISAAPASPPPRQQKLIKMRGVWSVISAVQESGRHRDQQESPNTASRHEESDTGNLILTPVIGCDLLRDCSCCYLFQLNILDLCLSRFSMINNWSEARSMGSGNKASSERLKTAMWNNFFLIEWSRVHHQYHFLPLLLWHHSPAPLGLSLSTSLLIIIGSCVCLIVIVKPNSQSPKSIKNTWIL